MARIELKGISHSFSKGERGAFSIDGLNLVWEDGSANALLGPSGCGKTTILNVISGLLCPNGGQVLFDGRDVTRLDARGRHIAQVFQFPVVYETLDVYGNLAFPLRNRKLPETDVDRRVREIAELLDLEGDLKSPARTLTPAQKQIVSLGRGIVREDTAAVLLDEPLTVIDPKMKWHLRRKLRDVQRATNLTMIYVTHDQHEALTFADSVTVMQDGGVVQTGAPQELHEDPATPFVGYFIGSPGMNLLPCTLAETGVDCGGIRVPVPAERRAGFGDSASDYTLGIRPEHITIVGEARSDSIETQVSNVENAGAYRILTVVADGIEFRVRSSASHCPTVGDMVHCVFEEKHIRVYSNGEAVRV